MVVSSLLTLQVAWERRDDLAYKVGQKFGFYLGQMIVIWLFCAGIVTTLELIYDAIH